MKGPVGKECDIGSFWFSLLSYPLHVLAVIYCHLAGSNLYPCQSLLPACHNLRAYQVHTSSVLALTVCAPFSGGEIHILFRIWAFGWMHRYPIASIACATSYVDTCPRVEQTSSYFSMFSPK